MIPHYSNPGAVQVLRKTIQDKDWIIVLAKARPQTVFKLRQDGRGH